MRNSIFLALLVLKIVVPSKLENQVDPKQEECVKISSCSTCITKSFCTWCVTKSKCTKQLCGNDNIIFPKDVSAIMAGPQFCPRVLQPETTLILKSGTTQNIIVKLTQIHFYMAFTPWKCKIVFNNEEMIVVAMLLGDSVYCAPVRLTNEGNAAYATGSVSVLWDYSKAFDGSVPFKVCRCDLNPTCDVCDQVTNDLTI